MGGEGGRREEGRQRGIERVTGGPGRQEEWAREIQRGRGRRGEKESRTVTVRDKEKKERER